MNPTTLDNEPSNVALPIGVKYLTTQPMLCDANVGWGVGGPVSGLDILPEPVPWSEEVLQKIEDQQPDLIQSLDNELEYLDRMGKHEHLRRSSRRPKAARLSFSVSC